MAQIYNCNTGYMNWQPMCFPGAMAPAVHTVEAAKDKLPRCQVPGCTANLTTDKVYCLRKRICSKHVQAEAMQYPGNQWFRFCFQCAKVHPLADFDGPKKSCRKALARRKMKAKGTANTAATKPDAPAPLQQQQEPAGKQCMQQRIATATEDVSEVFAVAQNLAAALSAKQAEIGAARAKLAHLHQQQQEMAALAAPIPETAGSRTPSPTVPAEPAPAAQPNAANAPAGQQQQQQQQQAPKLADSAGDAEFASLLESLLSEQDDEEPDSSMQVDEESRPVESRPMDSRPVGSTAASLQTAVAPPPFAAQPSGHWRGPPSRASSFHGAAAPVGNPAAAAAAAAAAVGPMVPFHGCGPNRPTFSDPQAYMPESASTGTCMPMAAPFGMVPAGVPAAGRGFAGMGGPVGSAGGVLMPCTGVSDGMARTAETLHSLNAMLHQVQSSIMALKQGILVSAALRF